MHKVLTVVIASFLLLASCGSKNDGSLEAKKAEMTRLKDQQDKLGKQITDLQAEIDRLDPASAAIAKAKLVSLTSLKDTSFAHYIDLQGNVVAENYSNISPQGTGGVIRAINVKVGDHVSKGQLLIKLDDALQRQTIASDQTQVEYSKDLYQRRKNLWDQKIGTEVDLVNAKNAVDQAEAKQKIDQEQLDWTNVYSDITGTVSNVNLKPGEFFSSQAQAQATFDNPGQLQVINTDALKVTVQVPEAYQERVRVGTPVRIVLPGLGNKVITGYIHTALPVISTANRSYTVEIHIPNKDNIRANQVAVVKLEDYTASKTVTIPVNTLLSDETGKYVMVATGEKGKLIAHKKTVTIGQSYGDMAEVTGGLQPGDQLITDGYQGLYEGQAITTQP
jgi:membrane fusion protein, multidrug efflux system